MSVKVIGSYNVPYFSVSYFIGLSVSHWSGGIWPTPKKLKEAVKHSGGISDGKQDSFLTCPNWLSTGKTNPNNCMGLETKPLDKIIKKP